MARSASAGRPTLSLEQQLAVQYSISRAFAEADELDEVARLVLKTLADAFGWQTSNLWVLDDDAAVIAVIAYADGEPAAAAVGYALDPVGVVGR